MMFYNEIVFNIVVYVNILMGIVFEIMSFIERTISGLIRPFLNHLSFEFSVCFK